MDHIYLIKNPAPWMIDELIVFAQHTQFKIIFIRKPGIFYSAKLEQLKEKGIEIVYSPFSLNINVKKIIFCIKFCFENIHCFLSRYSFVVGVKSLWWFLMIDHQHFQKRVSIHAQFATQTSLISMLFSKYYPQYGINYFFTFHAYDIYFNNKWFVKLVNSSRKCFSISDYNIHYVLNNYEGIDQSKIELTRLGAFSNSFNQNKKLKSKFFKIGLISWFVEKKGIRYLLEAMKKMADKNKDIKLILAGDGPLKDEIEEFITLNKLEGCIQYIGKLNFDAKSNFFLNLDAFVLPAITLENDKDGIPVVLMEAISYGLPIISTNVSGIPEICINNFNGFLIPERNVLALIEAITSLYNNEAMIRKYSINSLKVFDKYNIENNSYFKLKKLDWI